MSARFRSLTGRFLAVLFGISATGSAKEPERGWTKVEGEFKLAVASSDFDQAKVLASELAATEEAKGFRIILKHGVGGHDFDLDRHCGALLANATDKEVRELVVGTLREAKDIKTTIVLLAVVAYWADDPKALDALHRAASDPRKEIVFAALQQIRKVKLPEASLGSLIAELERRERSPRNRIYFDLRRTMRELTGHDFEAAVDWRNFWKSRGETGPPPAQTSGGKTGLAKSPSFFAVTLDTDRVFFVIDVSLSMEKKDPYVEEPEKEEVETLGGSGVTVVRRKKPRPSTKVGEPQGGAGEAGGGPTVVDRPRIDRVKEELIRTLQSLPDGARFGIMSFSHEIAFFNDSRVLSTVTAAVKAQAVQWVQALRPNGATRTDLALELAFQIPEVDTIFLLTDGAPRSEKNEPIPIELVLGIAARDNRFRKCRINTVGFIQAGGRMRELVEKLARQHDGHCVLLK
jgi:hypothetical protein